MGIESALYAHLTTDVGLAALVGARVYPLALPQQPTLPALTYQRISTSPTQHRDSAEPQHSRIRMQIDCWAASYDSALSVRAAVRAAMGTVAQASSPRIDAALLADDTDTYDPAPGRWRATLDYFIWSEE